MSFARSPLELKQKHLDDLSQRALITPEWKGQLHDPGRLQQLRLRHRSTAWLVRTGAEPDMTRLFKTASLAMAPRARLTKPLPSPPTKFAPKRRGRRGVVLRGDEFPPKSR